MILQDLVGKTVSKISQDVYESRMVVEFSDGTKLTLSSGTSGMHNDSWNTVAYKIHSSKQPGDIL